MSNQFKSVEFKSKDDVSKNSKISTDDEGNLIITTQIENGNNGKAINIKGQLLELKLLD